MKTPTKQTSRRIAAVLAIVLAFATTGAWAADWTVSENTALTEDKTVDALTVDSGVTLDLNGCSLTCTSLADSGTITSPSGTLTSPDTTEPYHVTWITKFGTDGAESNGKVRSNDNNQEPPRNLFTNTGRLLATTDYLPLAVTYDFCEGVSRKVDKYKVSGPSANAGRGPKAWTLEGSNDGSSWTEVDSRTGVKWSSNQSKEYTVDESKVASYRYYRMIFTESNDGTYLQLNQLEYFGPGELHVNVPADSEATVGSLTISGNMKVVKDGEGRLNGVTGIGSSTFPGMFEVNAGTVYVADDFKLGTTADGTLTINGGTVEVDASKTTHIGENSGMTGTVNLNGGILKTKRLVSINGTGRVNFDGGTLQANSTNSNGLFGNNVTVTVNERGGMIDSGNIAVKVPAAISGTGAMRFKGGNVITHNAASTYTGGTTIELGTKIITSNETAKNAILGNLVIDGKTKTADENGIVVFEYSGLTDEDVPTPVYKNCGPGTTIYRDGDTLKVNFVLPVWELTENATWSNLVAIYGAPDADVIVRIESSGGHTLTIDTDVDVKELVFNDDASATLTVDEDKTLTTENINGIGKIINNGTIVKTGTGTVDWPFDNASTGLYVVSAGTVRVYKHTGTGNAGSSQIIRVKKGATFDICGTKAFNFSVVLEEGSRFVNSSSDIGNNNSQAKSLSLEGDATVTHYRTFGLRGPGHGETTLNLGTYTLTLDSNGGNRDFLLDNTTISGTGTLFVKNGTLWVTMNDSVGEDCTVSIGSEGELNLGKNLTVKNFVNNGSISGDATLTVKGMLTPGSAAIANLTLAAGAKVKATGTAQVVSTTFAVSGDGDKTIKVDASALASETLDAGDVPVLTVPFSFDTSSATWNVTGAAILNATAKWRTDAGGTTKTLYVGKSTGLMVIFK